MLGLVGPVVAAHSAQRSSQSHVRSSAAQTRTLESNYGELIQLSKDHAVYNTHVSLLSGMVGGVRNRQGSKKSMNIFLPLKSHSQTPFFTFLAYKLNAV